MSKIFLITFLMILLMLQTAEAISLGTVVKNDEIEINRGETGKFTILFWNIEDNPYEVSLNVTESPKDWIIIIQPEQFVLTSSTGSQNIILPYIDKTVKALPVDVLVKPENVEGIYTITITAMAGMPGEGMSFFQERKFNLKVNVSESRYIQPEITAPDNMQELQQTIKESPQEKNPSYFFYIIVFVCILVVSLLIYKYA